MSVHLHKKHGLNPTMTNCFYCNEPRDIVLVGAATKQFKEAGLCGEDGEMPMSIGCVDREPCSKCKEYMEQGIIMISVDEEKSKGDMQNPYRTGGWVVVKEEAVKRIFHPEGLVQDVLKKRVAFVPDDAWDALGLPRGEHDPTTCGCKYLGNNAWSCGHIDQQ